ncbi:MAG: NADH-quinone oxidoreductase subunit NuoE [Oscillospiraceae bacterium]|nr:NADH-quinone oxidoreductase subunit NuoE [Oscillospiraceae bacterium]
MLKGGLSLSCAGKKQCDAAFERALADYSGDKSLLIPLLQRLQEAYGWLPPDILEALSARTGIPVPEILGVATFYAQFRLRPAGKHGIRLCFGTACHVNGSETIGDALRDELGVELGGTTEDGFYTLSTVACLGCCSLAPVMMIDGEVYGRLTPDKARQIVREFRGTHGEEAAAQ